MSATAADLAGASRADVIEGFILSRPTLRQYAAAEEHFRREYVVLLADSLRHAGTPQPVFERVMLKVAEDLRNFALGYGSLEFDLWATAPTNGELLTWLSLQVKHPQLKLDEVRAFYLRPAADDIYAATLELWGYRSKNSPPADPKNDGGQGTPSRSPGTSSTGDSAAPPPLASV